MNASFVTHHAKRVLKDATKSENVFQRLKISGNVWTRFEGRVRAVALKHDDGCGNGRVELDIREYVRERFAKLFEFEADAPDVLLARVTEKQKILGTHADPSVFRRHRGVLRNDDKKTKANSEGKGNAFHKTLTKAQRRKVRNKKN